MDFGQNKSSDQQVASLLFVQREQNAGACGIGPSMVLAGFAVGLVVGFVGFVVDVAVGLAGL